MSDDLAFVRGKPHFILLDLGLQYRRREHVKEGGVQPWERHMARRGHAEIARVLGCYSAFNDYRPE